MQGGKILGKHITIGCFIIGVPLLIIGTYALFNLLFGWGFPTDSAVIILILLVFIIDLLSVIGGYKISITKNKKYAGEGI